MAYIGYTTTATLPRTRYLGVLPTNGAPDFTSDGSTVISANSSAAALRITQVGAGNALLVEDSANPDSTPFVINQIGRVLIGKDTQEAVGGFNPFLQNHQVDGTAQYQWSADAGGAKLWFTKSRSATAGTQTIVQSGDQLGRILMYGSDGTAFIPAAIIDAAVDGTPGTNDMPGRLVFSTTADGASSPTERMRINNAGQVAIGGIPTTGNTFQVRKNITGAAFSSSISTDAQVQSDVTSRADYFLSASSVAAGTYSTINGFQAQQSTFTGTVTNQRGFSADSSLTGATNNYGFYGNIASGTGRWNFYANGTADNYFAGNVGIGFATPNTKLSFGTGTIGSANEPNVVRLYDTGTASSSYGFGVASGTLTVASGGTTVFARSGSESMRIDSSGNVGIGTSSPGTKLNIYTGSATTTLVRPQNTLGFADFGPTSDGTIYAPYAAPDTSKTLIVGTSNATPSTFWTNGSERMRIDISGNIGIGTSTNLSSTRLDVRSVNIADGTDVAQIGAYSTTAQAANVGGRINFGGLYDATSTISFGGIAGRKENGTSGDWSGYLQFSTRKFGGDYAERMRIDSSGNVGIGLTNGTNQLNVLTNSAVYRAGAAPAIRTIRSNTSVGSPTIVASSDILGNYEFQGYDGAAYINGASIRAEVDATPGTNDMPGRLVFSTTADGASTVTERMRIDSSGRVGIKTSSPAVELDVNGAVRVNAGASYQYYGASGGADQKVWDALSANDSGNTLFFRAVNDTYSASYTWLSVSRSGYQPQTITFSTGAGTERLSIDVNGFTKVTGSFGRGAPVTKTGNFTLAATENWIICNGTGSITVTLPAASSWTGRELTIKTIAAQTVVSASSNVVPLAGGSAGTAILAATAGKFATLVSDGTNWVIMAAN